jgi:hypothetical protein
MNNRAVNTTAASAAAAAAAVANTFPARGRPMLNEHGFFTQSDWEFQLDTIQETSREALEAHLSRCGEADEQETALFLKGFLMNAVL